MALLTVVRMTRMISKRLTIINKLGLHARAATKLVNHASRYGCNILLIKDNKSVNAKSIMGVMMLAASKGTPIEISCDGPDEEKAMNDLETLINDRFGEGA